MKRIFRTLAVVVALAALAFLFHNSILGGLGSFLVRPDSVGNADLVVVLAGDGYGDRIKTGAQLVRDGYAPKVLVSGPSGMYGAYECDLAIPFAVKAGYPESYFVHAEHDARSTVEEAHDLLPLLRKDAVKRVLLVTSDFHTRRSGRIFRNVAPDIKFIVIAAPGHEFTPDGWWHNRQGQKIAFNEWTKTFAEWLGI